MRTGKQFGAAGLAVAIAWSVLMPPGRLDATEPAPKSVRIGLVQSLFRDTPASLISIIAKPLKLVMEAQTGMSGELQASGDALALGQQLKDGKMQLGVFHGVEFAWAREKNPGLRPLVIAIREHRHLHAHLVVRKDSEFKTWTDLKGKTLALPCMTREHCHLWLERRCPDGAEPKKFFSRITKPGDPEDALDDVLDGVVDVAVVDRAALDKFQKNKPTRHNGLRVLQQSEPFPAAVIAYQQGSLSDETLGRFRSGLLGANKTTRGKELLKMCRIDGFEPVPDEFESMLKAILKAYPPPRPTE